MIFLKPQVVRQNGNFLKLPRAKNSILSLLWKLFSSYRKYIIFVAGSEKSFSFFKIVPYVWLWKLFAIQCKKFKEGNEKNLQSAQGNGNVLNRWLQQTGVLTAYYMHSRRLELERYTSDRGIAIIFVRFLVRFEHSYETAFRVHLGCSLTRFYDRGHTP